MVWVTNMSHVYDFTDILRVTFQIGILLLFARAYISIKMT